MDSNRKKCKNETRRVVVTVSRVCVCVVLTSVICLHCVACARYEK